MLLIYCKDTYLLLTLRELIRGEGQRKVQFLGKENNTTRLPQRTTLNCKSSNLQIKSDTLTTKTCCCRLKHQWHNRNLSLSGYVEYQENKKLCFCTASLALNSRLSEVCRTKTKLFILLRLNMAPRDKGLLCQLKFWVSKTYLNVRSSFLFSSDFPYFWYIWPT